MKICATPHCLKYEIFDTTKHTIDDLDDVYKNSITSITINRNSLHSYILNFIYHYYLQLIVTNIIVYNIFMSSQMLLILNCIILISPIIINLVIYIFAYTYIINHKPSLQYEMYSNKPNFFLVATEYDKIIAFASFKLLSPNKGWVTYFFVKREYKNKNIGKNLLIHLFKNLHKIDKCPVFDIKVYGKTTTLSYDFWNKYGTLEQSSNLYGFIPNIFPIKVYNVEFNISHMKRILLK